MQRGWRKAGHARLETDVPRIRWKPVKKVHGALFAARMGAPDWSRHRLAHQMRINSVSFVSPGAALI
jgi:hypothetical protein